MTTPVDNYCHLPGLWGQSLRMPPRFGDLLRQHRETRLMSQRRLAEKVGVSENTIQRAETADTFEMRRHTLIAVLVALYVRIPLSKKERVELFEAAGFNDLDVDRFEKLLAPRLAAADRTPQDVDDDLSPKVQEEEADHRTARLWTATLLDAVGPEALFAALQGLAASWEVPLPRRASTTINAKWLKREHPPKDGLIVTEFAPIEPPSGKTGAKPKARKLAQN